MLRCVDGAPDEIAEALERVSTSGAINYFPLRCFGAGSGGTAAECGIALLSGRYLDACGMWLQNEADRDYLFQPYFRQYAAADTSALGGLLAAAAAALKDQRASDHLVHFLRRLAAMSSSSSSSSGLSEDNAAELWHTVIEPSPTAIDRAALRAAPGRFLWNLAASQRLYQHGAKVAVGDFVAVTAPSSIGGGATVVRQVREGEPLSKFSLDDVVVPLPTTATTAMMKSSWYSTFYKDAAERFSIPEGKSNDVTPPAFRRLVLKPLGGSFAYQIVRDPNSLSLLKTDLFLRQERKLPQTVPLEERLRRPTPFNMSDAFRERMQPALHQFPPPSSSCSSSSSPSFPPRFLQRDSGISSSSNASSVARHSVAIECDLPSGSSDGATHILTLLREAFMLRHLHFNDMVEFSEVL
jgi:hypothetical protein